MLVGVAERVNDSSVDSRVGWSGVRGSVAKTDRLHLVKLGWSTQLNACLVAF